MTWLHACTIMVLHVQVHINQNLVLTIVARFILMQLIATNLCVWLQTVVTESLHDIHRLQQDHNHDEGNGESALPTVLNIFNVYFYKI